MAKNTHFDYIIIGNGLAGLQLALKMSEDHFFNDKQIALIDPSEKKENDKTWSFWETGQSQWDNLAYKSWGKASVITSKKEISLDFYPYSYKTLRAIDFYSYAKTQLRKRVNFHFFTDKVKDVEELKTVTITTQNNTYSASHVFDSRITENYSPKSKTAISITQHFKGWIIKTENDCFDDSSFTMMDYRLKDKNQTTFTYVLPFSKTEALVEFTYFTEQIVSDETYDSFIKTYINDFLKIDNYSIIETEVGNIPMTSFPFEKSNSKNITKIGTAGGWVKGSTGYSFKHTEKKVAKIVENLKYNRLPSKDLFKKRFKFYDKVFLKVLKDENNKGEWLFQQFYKKNAIQSIFRFLDEESTFIEELKIMKSLLSWSFIKAFFKTL
ncbi:lycopene cyclase family protein [Flavobacteriaceae bacterium SZ-1-7]|uniref:lycopene cyclase family protein n=1 Tax=Tamlana sedimenti TaxID=3134126 RepID=UPI003127EBDC